VTEIEKCVHDYDYCDDNALCQSYQVDGELDCEKEYAITFMSLFIVSIGAAYAVSSYFTMRRTFTEHEPFFVRSFTAAFFAVSVAFFAVSLWAAITLDPLAVELWAWYFLIIFGGSILCAFVLLSIPFVITAVAAINEFVTSPVSARVLVALIFVIPALVAICFILVLIELCLRRELVAAFSEFSIIALGADWAMLIWEYQTPESKRKLVKCWAAITFDKHLVCDAAQQRNGSQDEKHLNRNTDVHLIETNQMIDHKQEQPTYSSAVTSAHSANLVGVADTSSIPLMQNTGIKQEKVQQDEDNKLSKKTKIQLLVIHLFLYVVWMMGWIGWAFGNEQKEPCFMNIATGGPVFISILKRYYYAYLGKDTKALCCCCCGSFVLASLLIFGWLSCTCEGSHIYCVRFHVAVVVIVGGWAWVNLIDHMVHRSATKNSNEEQQ